MQEHSQLHFAINFYVFDFYHFLLLRVLLNALLELQFLYFSFINLASVQRSLPQLLSIAVSFPYQRVKSQTFSKIQLPSMTLVANKLLGIFLVKNQLLGCYCILQDGAGRVGKMLFARQGKKFDYDLKQVRCIFYFLFLFLIGRCIFYWYLHH